MKLKKVTTMILFTKMYELLPWQMVQNIAEKIHVMCLVKKNQKHVHNQQQHFGNS